MRVELTMPICETDTILPVLRGLGSSDGGLESRDHHKHLGNAP
jgi:hypothetical protein